MDVDPDLTKSEMQACPLQGQPRPKTGFTLLELLVSMAVLAIVLVIVLTATGQMQKVFTRSASQTKSFEAARSAYEAVTQRLTAATLNTYLDYDNPASPLNYVRISELHFLTGPVAEVLPTASVPGAEVPPWGDATFFAVPAGFSTNPATVRLKDLLNAGGFFVEYGDGRLEKPAILGNLIEFPKRYRLVELLEPTEDLTIYNHDPRGLDPAKQGKPWEWIDDALANGNRRNIRLLAENIIGFFLWPQTSDGTFLSDSKRTYDTRVNDALTSPQPVMAHQLPQVVRVVMVALAESSAVQLDNQPGGPAAVLEPAFANLFNAATTNKEVDVALKTLEERLLANKLEFRMFNSYVQLGEAKWNE